MADLDVVQLAQVKASVTGLASREAVSEGKIRLLERQLALALTRLSTAEASLGNVSSFDMMASSNPLLTEKVIYVRPGGSDLNDGSEISLAVATLRRAMELVPVAFEDRRYVIDLTGMTVTETAISSLAAKISSIGSWQNFDQTGGGFADASIMAFGTDYYRGALTFRATPTPLVSGIAVSSQVADTVTGMYSVTTTSNFTLNQHRGKLLYGAGFVECAVIVSNTAGPNSVIKTTTNYPFAGPLTICDYGAEMTLGDTSDQLNQPNKSIVACALQFTGIKFNVPPDALPALSGALSITSSSSVDFSQCELQGATLIGGGLSLIENCYCYGPTGNEYLGAFGFGLYLRNSYVRTLRDGTHGDGAGSTNRGWCVFEQCQPWGHGGTSEPHHSWNFDYCEFIDPVTYALYYRGPIHCRFKDSRVSDSQYAVYTEHVGSLTLDNVRGTMTIAGVRLGDGVQLTVLNMTDVTGVQGPATACIVLSDGVTLGYDANTYPIFGCQKFVGEIRAMLGMSVEGGSAASVQTGVYNPGGLLAMAVAGTLRGFFDGNGFNGQALLSKLTVTGGPITVTPVALVDDSGGANQIAVNAAIGSSFKHTLTENTQLNLPSNMVEGMRLRFTFVQAAGLYAVTFVAGYLFGAEGAPHTEWTASGKAVIVEFEAISNTQLRVIGYQVNVG